MPIIYHVTTAGEWKTALQNGEYESPSLKSEGFIHCSEEHQVAAVLEEVQERILAELRLLRRGQPRADADSIEALMDLIKAP